MTSAWLFPGQGAEQARMGLAIAERHPEASQLLDHVSRLLELDARVVLTRGSRALDRTEILQPLLTAVSLGAALALGTLGSAPDWVAGHSLGELAAWAAAGALSPEQAITLAAERGRLMAGAAAAAPGGMLALTDATEADVERALACGRRAGSLVLSAHNAPGEWILAGDESALRLVEAAVPSVRLRVSGPWHSPAMAAVGDSLRAAAERIPRGRMRAPLVSSITGELVDDSSLLPEQLRLQLVSPVRWAKVMRTLGARASHLVTCGPGKVLRSLAHRNLGPSIPVLATETPALLDRARLELAG